jgi:dTDP-4-amino-4,6-dideoxygalactose transaminase
MEFPAALGVSQLRKADWIFMRRQENVRYLNEGLKKFEEYFDLPIFDVNVSYLAYPMTIKEDSHIKRRWLRRRLDDRGIENRPLFGCIPTQQPAFSHLKPLYQETLPVANYIGRNAFYIGCHQYLEKDDLDYIISIFKEIFAEI